ncbi:hypothetical protein C8D77_104235 [Mesorhizobium loti]|uniref:Uncharacterized protein n=1 Tax=Rhizobium loti TaxID=381 RepID=A0A8E3B446_RHILI|nr:hypothetical protein C8D77_104235 [Mesorhizobium loti]
MVFRMWAPCPDPALRATFSPRGEEIVNAGACLFTPAGRRWPRSSQMREPLRNPYSGTNLTAPLAALVAMAA